MGKKVKIRSDEASEDDSIEFTSNTAGALTPVLRKTVQSPHDYVLVNTYALRTVLENSSGDRIKDGEIVVAVSPPDTRDRREVDEKYLRTYGELSRSEQRQDDFASQVGVEVEQGELVVPTDHEIIVLVDSSEEIDTGSSFVELEAQREQ